MRKLLLILAILIAPNAWATTYYIANGGDNTRSCATASNIGTPKQTLGNFITNCGGLLVPGDIIYLRGGTYAESNNTFDNHDGTSWASPITLSAYPGETVTVAPSGSNVQQGLVIRNTSYFQVVNIIFDCALGGGSCISMNVNNDHIRISGGEVKNAGRRDGGYGICPSACSNNGITAAGVGNEFCCGLKVYNNGSGGIDHGIYGFGFSGLIDGIEVYHNAGHGMQKYSDGDNNIIRNSIFHDNGVSGFLSAAGGGGSGLGMYGGTGNYVYNVLSYGNCESGITANYGEHDDFYYNNTVYNNQLCNGSGLSAGGISLEEGATYTCKNNLSIDNTGTEIFGCTVTATNITTGTAADIFVAPGSNFHLASSTASPVGAGTDLSATFTGDIEGVLRGALFDIGAYEYAGPNPPIPIPVTQHDVSAVTTATGTASTVLTITVGDHPLRDMSLGIGWYRPGTEAVSTIVDDTGDSWGSSICTVTTGAGGTQRLSVYNLKAPTIGTHHITVTLTGVTDFGVGASSFYLVNQATGYRFAGSSGTGQTGSSSTPTSSVTSVIGDLVIDHQFFFIHGGDPATGSVGANQTENYHQDLAGANFFGGSRKVATATSTSLSWTMDGTANDWSACSVSLIPQVNPITLIHRRR